MVIPVRLYNGSEVQNLTLSEFEHLMGVSYTSQLQFATPATEEKIFQLCAEADQKKWIDPRQKWLGSYYSQEIAGKHHNPSITIAWIDSTFGYGVFTNRAISRHAFIGEYTGIVRKRHLFGRWKNAYCFDYTIGFGRKTPYVIDAKAQGNFTRYINHSDHPNLETASVLCKGMMHLIFYAIVDIPEGAQLTCDYGAKYWKGREPPLPNSELLRGS